MRKATTISIVANNGRNADASILRRTVTPTRAPTIPGTAIRTAKRRSTLPKRQCDSPPTTPVATFAIGEAGAANAALHVIANLATTDRALREQLLAFRARQTEAARAMKVPL